MLIRRMFELIDQKLDHVMFRLKVLTMQGVRVMKELDDLEVQVKANTDAEESAGLLLGRLHDLIVAAGTDPVKLKALTDGLVVSHDKLKAAVVAHTPA